MLVIDYQNSLGILDIFLFIMCLLFSDVLDLWVGNIIELDTSLGRSPFVNEVLMVEVIRLRSLKVILLK